MCIAVQNQFDCVGCDAFVTSTMTISRFCRRKADVDAMRGRFVFPATDAPIVFPKTGEPDRYYSGKAAECAPVPVDVDAHSTAADTIIPHRYFRVRLNYTTARFCRDCLQAKHRRDVATAKQLDARLVRKHLGLVAAGKPGSVQKESEEHYNVFDGEWCYYVPETFPEKWSPCPVYEREYIVL